MSKKQKNLQDRPAWDDGTQDPKDVRRPPLQPVWAAETVTLPRQKFVDLNPDNLPEYQDPQGPRLPRKKEKIVTASGKVIDETEPSMVWKCPYCDHEWYADEPGRCPNCHTDLYAPRTTYGVMYPLIAAMEMIDQGYDPRTGEIDEVLDRLMDEQIRSVGGTRPVRQQPAGTVVKNRLLFIEPGDEPKRKDQGATYVRLVNLPEGKTPKCPCCKLPMKVTQRIVELQCNHKVHANCLSTLFKKGDGKCGCPTCNAPVTSAF